MTRKLYIKTWGCQMNVYDSAKMAEVLQPHGYAPTDSADDADMVILNTCHIREKATEKVFSELGRLKQVKAAKAERDGKAPLLAVAGCVAQAEGETILERAPYVDLVFGPQAFHRLPELVAQAEARGPEPAKGASPNRGVIDTDFPVESKFDYLPEESLSQGAAAYLAIQEGCDKFCSFCVVRYTRGAEHSRPVDQVLAEARRLVASGAREVTLLGQNVNAYHGEGPDGREWGLGRLIYALAEIEGLQRIRYTTSHPRDVDEELIAAHRDVAQLMPFLHLPVQSGSDRVLQAMNRKHTAEHYLRIVERLLEARPDLALSSDFIVGFPGETDADFAETLALVNEVGFAQAYSFKYSPRPGTPAAEGTPVPEDVKDSRLQALQQLLGSQQHAYNQRFEGQTIPVLLDREGRKPGQLMGRAPHGQAVHVAANPRLLGQLADVVIERGQPNSLAGRIATGTYESTPAAAARPAAEAAQV